MNVRFGFALAAVLASCAVAPLAAATDPLEAAAQQYVAELEVRQPLFADGIGVHAQDNRLPDVSAKGLAESRAWEQAWRTKFATFNRPGATLDSRADASAMLDRIDRELFEDEALHPYQTDPTRYTSIIGGAVNALTSRTYAPADERYRHVGARLALIPAIVSAAKDNLTIPPRVVTEQAIGANTASLTAYAKLPMEAASLSPETRALIDRNLPSALAALRDFDTFLRGPLLVRSNGETRIGAEAYDRLFALTTGTDSSRADVIARARADFDLTRQKMLALARPMDRQLFPNDIAAESKPDAIDVVVRRVLDKLADNHPTRDTVFSTAEADVDAAVAFLQKDPVVIVPTPSTLVVKPTPPYLAGVAGASSSPPGPFSPMAESFYYIDEIPAAWDQARVTGYLRDNNNYEMKILSVHEAMPGHYLQLRYAGNSPSTIRKVFGNGSFIEGWACYTEGMMLDAGYGDNDPKLRLFQLKWRLREQANVIIDAGYHTANMSHDQIDDLLVRQAYQEHVQADTKWHRLQLSHLQLVTYYVGLDAITRAQNAQRAALGSKFDLAKFNAALLAMGSPEPRFIEPLLSR
jgi:hypothetical protein